MNAFQAASPKKKMITLLAIYCGLIGATLVSATQSTMLPIAAQDIGGTEIYGLVNTLSGVISVIAMPLFGYFGAKNPALKTKLFIVSLFAGAAVFLSRVFVNDMWLIVIPSALYGFVSAGVYVLGFSLIRDIYDQKKAAMYLGFVVSIKCVAQLGGPILCGLLIDYIGWRAVNHMIWPFLLVGAVLALLGVNPTKEEVKDISRNTKFDLPGALFLTVFLAGFLLTLALGASYAKFGSAASWALIAVAVIGLAGLSVVIKKKGQESILPIAVLKDRNTLCLAASTLAINMAGMAVNFFIPSYCIYILGSSATQASLTVTVLSIVGIFMGPVYGKIVGKSGNAKGIMVVGYAIRTALIFGVVLISKFFPNYTLLLVVMFFMGFGNSATSAATSIGPQMMLKDDVRVQGNSIIQLSQNFGGSIASSIYMMFIGMYGIEAGLVKAFTLAGVMAAVALVMSLLLKKPKAE